ncbi:GSCOCG00001637001-RA-CDS [Cotesia congregata]|nr:GSCOCG00001637001-RA-CDS [Cotesia congregata]
MVFILNPSVGDIVSMGSPMYLFKIVVFPALSRPLIKIRISFSFCFNFFNTVNKPIIFDN